MLVYDQLQMRDYQLEKKRKINKQNFVIILKFIFLPPNATFPQFQPLTAIFCVSIFLPKLIVINSFKRSISYEEKKKVPIFHIVVVFFKTRTVSLKPS